LATIALFSALSLRERGGGEGALTTGSPPNDSKYPVHTEISFKWLGFWRLRRTSGPGFGHRNYRRQEPIESENLSVSRHLHVLSRSVGRRVVSCRLRVVGRSGKAVVGLRGANGCHPVAFARACIPPLEGRVLYPSICEICEICGLISGTHNPTTPSASALLLNPERAKKRQNNPIQSVICEARLEEVRPRPRPISRVDRA
jgi:hypothetical protein